MHLCYQLLELFFPIRREPPFRDGTFLDGIDLRLNLPPHFVAPFLFGYHATPAVPVFQMGRGNAGSSFCSAGAGGCAAVHPAPLLSVDRSSFSLSVYSGGPTMEQKRDAIEKIKYRKEGDWKRGDGSGSVIRWDLNWLNPVDDEPDRAGVQCTEGA